MKILLNYDYPGNVRELQNILEHALIVCQENIIELEHLPLSLQNRFLPGSDDQVEKKKNLQIPLQRTDERERDTILKTLRNHSWHRAKTAKALGIDRTTLWRKIKVFDIRPS